MKIILIIVFLSLPCFAQKDMQVSLTNGSVSVWNRKPESGENSYKKRDPNIKDMKISFTMTISTKAERAYPVSVQGYALVEKKDGARTWKLLPSYEMTGFKWKGEFKELKSSEIKGIQRIDAGLRNVDGKIIAWSLKAMRKYDEDGKPKYLEPVMLEWKDKNAKDVKNPPMIGSNLEEKPI